MDIKPYQSYFHDGSITGIKRKGAYTYIAMNSAELIPEFGVNDVPLDSENCIAGYLSIYNIQKITINDNAVNEIEMYYEEGEILDLEVNEGNVYLNIVWETYPSKQETTKYEEIYIFAEKFEWHNFPESLQNIS